MEANVVNMLAETEVVSLLPLPFLSTVELKKHDYTVRVRRRMG
jgi:hypothetical protein